MCLDKTEEPNHARGNRYPAGGVRRRFTLYRELRCSFSVAGTVAQRNLHLSDGYLVVFGAVPRHSDEGRRYLTSAAVLAVVWILLRTVKFSFVPVQTMARPLWYLYYLPMLFIPLMAVCTAASLGRPENDPTPKSVLALFVPTVLLLLLVLTNDWHQLVFTFPGGKPWTDYDYGYGFGFYLVMGWELLLSFAAFGVMVRRCRVRTRKTAIPLIFMGLSLVYTVLYTAGFRRVSFLAGDVSVVQCCLFALTFESCIRRTRPRSGGV